MLLQQWQFRQGMVLGEWQGLGGGYKLEHGAQHGLTHRLTRGTRGLYKLSDQRGWMYITWQARPGEQMARGQLSRLARAHHNNRHACVGGKGDQKKLGALNTACR